jgi:3-hydroxyisobutyrate dehydrogenase-like beta-hydroxyacid dehydrogenase
MMDERSITVLGLGRMGSAIAETLIVAGHEVTVWNRTPEKAHSFDGRARVAASVVEACRMSEVIIVCVLNYDTSDALLRVPDVEPLLAGKTLVQLSSGTPERAREAGAWAASVDLAYLDGTMSAGPKQIGSDAGTIYYTGAPQTYEACGNFLEGLVGTSVYCGTEMGHAAALDFAHLGVICGTAMVVYNALALLAAESVDAEELFATLPFFDRTFLEGIVQGVTSRNYPSGNASMTIWRAWAEQFVRSEVEAGVDSKVPKLLRDYMIRAIELGHGDDDLSALYEALRPQSV